MKISFMIPTYNRSGIIISALDEIVASINASKADAEIIVIDNNSSDNTYQVVSAYKQNCAIPIKLSKESKSGINHARNKALSLSSGDLLIFIDDDCHLDINYVRNITDHFSRDTKPVLRCTAVHIGDPADWPMTIKTYPEKQRWDILHPENGYMRTGDIIGCSMAFPREIYERIGDFDVLFSTNEVPGGNDTDYGMRAYLAGFPIEYVPDVIVKHFHGRRDEKSVHRLVEKYCIGGGAVYAKFLWRHPHIRQKISRVKLENNQRLAPDRITDERDDMIKQFYEDCRVRCHLSGFVGYYWVLIKYKLGILTF